MEVARRYGVAVKHTKSKYIEITQVRDMQRTKSLINVGGARFPRPGNAAHNHRVAPKAGKKESKSHW